MSPPHAPGSHEATTIRERILASAVRAGKITDAHLDEYRGMFDRDPVGTQQLLAMLASSGADLSTVDHTGGAVARSGANHGADDSVLRATQQHPPTLMDGEQRLVPAPGGGYITVAQANANAAQQALLDSYESNAPAPSSDRIHPVSD